MNKNIDLVFKNYTNSKVPRQSFFKNVLETATRELKLKGKVGVSVNLVGEAKIRELNRKYRNKNKATDVLSFPLKEKLETPTRSGRGADQSIGLEDIGDIFVCLPIAKNEAKRENISVEAKLAQLTVHGFLHLLGYDHEKSKQSAKKMFKLESKIFKSLKLKV